MEYSWPAECVIKLIQWKYGSLIPLQELQRIQRIEYDPGGSLGRFCRTLSQYSNAVVFFALSFAMVNASGHYVNQGVMAAAAATFNGSDLYPPLAAGKTATTSTLADLSLDLPLRRVLPAATPRGSILSLYDELVTAASATPFAAGSSVTPSSTAFAPTSGAADTFGTDAPDAHISGGPLTNDSVASTNDSGGAEFGVDSIASTVAGVFLSINDSQVPRFGNRTPYSNATEIEGVGYFGILSVVLGLMILLTIVGNVFVIAAILIEKNLQNVANYLIVSLAVADLMVACLVMPLGAVYEMETFLQRTNATFNFHKLLPVAVIVQIEDNTSTTRRMKNKLSILKKQHEVEISEGWVLGPELCDMWTASDVLCCTASILHLVAIALDRYWAVTDVEYITRRSAWRIVAMIIIIWTVALVVSVAPQFGWKDPGYLDRINKEKRCLVSQDIGYQIFATCATFYVPLLAILVLYWKIFQAARRRIHKRNLRNPMYLANAKMATASITRKRFAFFKRKPKIKAADAEAGAPTNIALMDIPSSCSAAESSQENAKEASRNDCHDNNKPDHIGVDRGALHANSNDAACTSAKMFIEASSMSTIISKQIQKVKSKRDKKQSLEAKREKKAAKTLAIITGAFVICWLPFFVMAIAMPMCPSCHVNRYISSFFLWLGYFNSTLNPIIYTVFSPEFRQAFNRILCGIHKSGLRTR